MRRPCVPRNDDAQHAHINSFVAANNAAQQHERIAEKVITISMHVRARKFAFHE